MKKILLLLISIPVIIVLQANTWTINSSGTVFIPDSITIEYGDTILFQLSSFDNAQEISQAAWNANDTTPIIGFITPLGGGMVTGLSEGVHYYTSVANANLGMKGRIFVLPPATVRFRISNDSIIESSIVRTVLIDVNNPTSKPVNYTVALNAAASTATAGIDFTFSNLPFTVPIGSRTDTVRITLKDETLIELNETIVLNFRNLSTNLVVTVDSVYTLTVLDNDTLHVSFVGAAFTYSEKLGEVAIRIAMSSPVPYENEFIVVRDTGNATHAEDFICNDTTFIRFEPGNSDTAEVLVELIDDTLAEGVEQINFSLYTSKGDARFGIRSYTIFIIDDDAVSGIVEYGYNEEVAFYPNPATDKLYLQYTVLPLELQLLDLSGMPMIKTTSMDVLDVSILPQGIYFLQLRFGQKSINRRVIILR